MTHKRNGKGRIDLSTIQKGDVASQSLFTVEILILMIDVTVCHLASIQELKFTVGGHHFPEPGISIGGD